MSVRHVLSDFASFMYGTIRSIMSMFNTLEVSNHVMVQLFFCVPSIESIFSKQIFFQGENVTVQSKGGDILCKKVVQGNINMSVKGKGVSTHTLPYISFLHKYFTLAL